MKILFLSILSVMIVASVFTYRSLPTVQSEVPVLYWVTDANPARVEQIRTFRRWLRENNHPDIDLRVDTVNVAPEKVLVQGVSGVAGDVLDHTGGERMRFLQTVGMLEDVTEWGQKLGFDPSQTYPAMVPEITIEGRQYAFPCNVTAHMLWVNRETFERYGIEPPPRRWTVEDFERIGREFVERANPPGRMRRVFMMAGADWFGMARSRGVCLYNETQTAPILNDPRVIEVFDRVYRWTYVDNLLPSAAERSGFATESGYGGATFQLFNNGNYAMLGSGRYALIQLRRFSEDRVAAGGEPMKLDVVEMPHYEMPVSMSFTRASAVYAAGPHPELARLFLAFLASEDYNMNIVDDGDALPPNPKYTETEEFKRPKAYPNEWGLHEAFSEAALTIAVSAPSSPFILDTVASRIRHEAFERFMNDRATAEEAVLDIEERILDEMTRSMAEQPELRAEYEERLERQQRIDALRRDGQPVPLSWIDNPFYRTYYVFKGWADEEK